LNKVSSQNANPLDLRMDNLSSNIMQQMQQLQDMLNNQMKEHRDTLSVSSNNIGTRLDQAANLFGQVQSRLGQLEESSKRIFEVGKDLSGLQDILKAPKLRGGLGELFLDDMLAQIFTKDQYSLQYRFKSGEAVDAIVHLKDNMKIPIDAKFPLENFKKVLNTDDDVERDLKKKLFISDVKKHIDDISRKYILPNEGTLDIALMYIPAENIYYEIIVKDEKDGNLMPYALKKRVFPVSPNTLYIYLQAILLGLRGMKIEEEAMSILKHIQSLSSEFNKFSKNYTLVGKHLTDAQTKFIETERQINKIGNQIESIDKHPRLAEPEGENSEQ
jgi:DNA recombination protein RmuC